MINSPHLPAWMLRTWERSKAAATYSRNSGGFWPASLKEHKLPAGIYLNVLQPPGIIKVPAKLYQFNGFATCIKEKCLGYVDFPRLLFNVSACSRTRWFQDVSGKLEKDRVVKGKGERASLISTIMQIAVFTATLVSLGHQRALLFSVKILSPFSCSLTLNNVIGSFTWCNYHGNIINYSFQEML